MTKREGAILSAYTGLMLCDFDDFHHYVEELLHRPVQTMELGFPNISQKIKNLSQKDFEEIMNNLED